MQWRKHADKGEVRRCTWVCGDQRVLVEEVVDTTRTLLAPTELDYVSLHAGVDSDASIWAAASQYPLTPGAARLITVRSAEKMTRWEPLGAWMDATRTLPGAHLLLVASDIDFPYLMVDGKKAGLRPHVETIQTRRRSGMIVRCASPNEADAITWARRRAPALTDDTARYLLTRTGGNLATVAGVCAKLTLFDTAVRTSTIDALCAENPAQSYVDYLLNLRKPQALLAAHAMDFRDYGKAISHLDRRLDLLSALWRAARAGLSAREVSGLPPFLVRQYLPCARFYEPARCVNRRRLLAVVDDAYRSGARDGILEAVVALW